MGIIKWTENFELPDPKINQQHKSLVDLLNRLAEVTQNDQNPDTVEQTLKKIITYTEEHFAEEERWLRSNNYKYLKEHIAEHRTLTTKVKKLKDAYLEGQTPMTTELVNLLVDWILEHIMGSDLESQRIIYKQKGQEIN